MQSSEHIRLSGLDERCDEASLEVHDSFTGLCDSLEMKNILTCERRLEIFSTHENQILNEVRQTAIGQHEQSRHWAGNAFGVSVALSDVSVIGGAVGVFVGLFCSAAAADELQRGEVGVTKTLYDLIKVFGFDGCFDIGISHFMVVKMINFTIFFVLSCEEASTTIKN